MYLVCTSLYLSVRYRLCQAALLGQLVLGEGTAFYAEFRYLPAA